MVGYIYRRHADIPKARYHEVVNEGNHTHDELLCHDRQGNSQDLTVKRPGAKSLL